MSYNKYLTAERIKQCRQDLDLTQEQLANCLGISRISLAHFESGERAPRAEQLFIMAETFNVSTDYLLGISDAATTDMKIKDICDYTGLSQDNIIKLHNKSNLNCNLQQEYGVLYKSYGWNDTVTEDSLVNHFGEVIKLDINNTKEYIDEIMGYYNDFLSSTEFNNILLGISQAKIISDDAISYLAVLFKDYDYIKKTERFITDNADSNNKDDKEKLFDFVYYLSKDYENAPAHNPIVREYHLGIFEVQNMISSFFKRQFDVLEKMDNSSIDFGKIIYFVYHALNACDKNDLCSFEATFEECKTCFSESEMNELQKIFEDVKAKL